MDPKTPISHLPGIGPAVSRKLQKIGVANLEDLIYHFPFRYEDYSKTLESTLIEPGDKVNFTGTVWEIRNIRTRSGKFITKAVLANENSTVDVIWFNQSYLSKNIPISTTISISGKAEREGSKVIFKSPAYEVLKKSDITITETPQHTSGIVAIYPETEGITSRFLRTKIKTFLSIYTKSNPDFMPQEIIDNKKLLKLEDSLQKIHFPKNWDDIKTARRRLGFDELFITHITSIRKRNQWLNANVSRQLQEPPTLFKEFQSSLRFTLTNSQKKAIKEITADLNGSSSQNRLLEGDVGSGKTVVAAYASLIAHKNGFQTIIAAPTEILAIQHQKTLSESLKIFNIKVGIWTKNKKEEGDITCGTHALLTSFEPTKELALVVVDEQHRFGVAQRSKLFLQNQKYTPHLLTMTATPIPRTLALTMYGDLDLSVLDEMPKGRKKISTFVVPNTKRGDCYKFIEKEVQSGRQAFIITPFVEPSESMQTVKSATVELEKLKQKFDKKIKLGLLHGRLKGKEKEDVMQKFKESKLDVLVATPVVEVGIDIPNATVIVIESADRFGLAQLHQLRGRVGRGEYKSYCFLFTDSDSQTSIKRLKSMEKVHVGFELAEIDLKMRGPGETFGLKQSGFENFKIANIFDPVAVNSSQQEAQKLIKTDPNLTTHPLLAKKLNDIENSLSQPN